MTAGEARLDRLRQRLAAALRGLAEDPALAVRFDAAEPRLDQTGAHLPALNRLPAQDDWIQWRALADRLALRRRHPPPLKRAIPAPVGVIVEALWQARAEAWGAHRWLGVAANISETMRLNEAPPGTLPLPERAGLLAHRLLGVVDLPARTASALDDWARQLRAQGVPLDRLGGLEQEPRRYAAASLRVARSLARNMDSPAHTPVRAVTGQTDRAPVRTGRRRANRSTTTEPSESFPPSAEADSASYAVFSHAHDQTLRPGDLARAGELGHLRRQLEEAEPQDWRLVARLARLLERHLRAARPIGWLNLREEGRLDPRRLGRVVVEPGWPLAYRLRADRSAQDTVVTLLIDNSASMRGRRIRSAALCADLLTRSLERCGIKVELLGFTTASWDGGLCAEAWRQAGQPPRPGRLNARRHVIYKGADTPWRRARNALGLMMKEGLLKENIDGEALEWAARKLIRRPERRRVLILLGDGVPHDRATAAANDPGYLVRHLEQVVARLQARTDLELLAIGFGPAVARYYSRSVRLRRPEDLAPVLTDELAKLLGDRRSAG